MELKEDTILEKSLTNKFFKKMKHNTINNKCADCNKSSPIWVTTTYSFFICSDCASKHREMGVLKSKVKSTLLDRWKICELRRLWVGGNKYNYKLGDVKDIFTKYKNADFYKLEIDKLVEESYKNEKYEFLNVEETVDNLVSTDIQEIEIPKFYDDIVENIKSDKNEIIKSGKNEIIKSGKNEIIKSGKEKFCIKKKNKPILSKNKKYEIEDESRLGFINK